MRLTSKRRRELDLLMHYIPQDLKPVRISDSHIQHYFNYSDHGIGEVDSSNPLFQAKRVRDLAVSWYANDWGYLLTSLDFVKEPLVVAQFVSKALGRPGIMDMWRLFNEHQEKVCEEFRPLVEEL